MGLHYEKGWCFVFFLSFHLICTFFIATRADENEELYSKSIANFLRIHNELQQRIEAGRSEAEGESSSAMTKRTDILNPAHEGWNGRWFHHLKTQSVPDFGHHEIHTTDEHGEKFHLDSSPRHHVHHGHHHMPHYHHEAHTFHHGGEHPHMNHEHYVHHEPMYHHIPVVHHAGHHSDHHYSDEESGDHEEHHEEETMHGDTDDWDVGGGYFQLEEHGSDVNVVALKKHGTKVHMSGGDFNVIRDPWRHHSLFAGLFHPHEMPGHGHLPMEQFHQHFTYIANDRAINHHVYEHHTHNEDNHVHEHDPGHEHDYFYQQPDNHGGKRVYAGSSPINVTAKAQVKQEISSPMSEPEDVINIPLTFPDSLERPLGASNSPRIVPIEVPSSDYAVKSQILASDNSPPNFGSSGVVLRPNSLPIVEVADQRSKAEEFVKEKKELPKGKSPRFSPFNGDRFGPREAGKSVNMPFAPIFKRGITNAVLKQLQHLNISPDKRSLRLRKAFLAKLLSSKPVHRMQ